MSNPILKKIAKHIEWMDLKEGDKSFNVSSGKLVGIVVKNEVEELFECSSVDLDEFCRKCPLTECIVKRERA